MKPSMAAETLRSISSRIAASKSPRPDLVAVALRSVLAGMTEHQKLEIQKNFDAWSTDLSPDEMSDEIVNWSKYYVTTEEGSGLDALDVEAMVRDFIKGNRSEAASKSPVIKETGRNGDRITYQVSGEFGGVSLSGTIEVVPDLQGGFTDWKWDGSPAPAKNEFGDSVFDALVALVNEIGERLDQAEWIYKDPPPEL